MSLLYQLCLIMAKCWQALSHLAVDAVPVTSLIFSLVAIGFVLSLVRGKI